MSRKHWIEIIESRLAEVQANNTSYNRGHLAGIISGALWADLITVEEHAEYYDRLRDVV